MLEIDDKAYTLDLNNVRLPEENNRHNGGFKKGHVSWCKGKTWNEMFDEHTRERLKEHLREIAPRGNMGKGFESTWRPVIQMDEYGNRLHWYKSSGHAARKLGVDQSNIRAVCYGKRYTCGGFRWKFDENFL